MKKTKMADMSFVICMTKTKMADGRQITTSITKTNGLSLSALSLSLGSFLSLNKHKMAPRHNEPRNPRYAHAHSTKEHTHSLLLHPHEEGKDVQIRRRYREPPRANCVPLLARKIVHPLLPRR